MLITRFHVKLTYMFRELEKQVESGQMKLVDEKRALAEISNSRRIRRVVDGFQEDQKKIEEDRHAVEELKKLLDDPEVKAMSNRFEAITAELATLKAGRDEANASKSKLFEERDGIQTQIKALLNEKREFWLLRVSALQCLSFSADPPLPFARGAVHHVEPYHR